jgi:nucleoside-diphosphate-sugar epimerase
MRATNLLRREGTRNLLMAARIAGVRRYVGESMMFIYGFGKHPGPVDESQEAGRAQSDGLQAVTDALVACESQIAAFSAAGEIEGSRSGSACSMGRARPGPSRWPGWSPNGAFL